MWTFAQELKEPSFSGSQTFKINTSGDTCFSQEVGDDNYNQKIANESSCEINVFKYKVFYVRGLLSVGRLCGYTWLIRGHRLNLLLHKARQIRITVLLLLSWLHVSGIWRCLCRLSSWILIYTGTFIRLTSLFVNSLFIVKVKKLILPVVGSARY